VYATCIKISKVQNLNKTYILLTKWKIKEEKNHSGQPNPGNPLSEDKAST